MKKSDFKFFFKDNEYYCSVKLSIGRRPTVYMRLGYDNRPFDAIIDEINLAYDLLLENYDGDRYLMDVDISMQLPRLLGYKWSTVGLSNIMK